MQNTLSKKCHPIKTLEELNAWKPPVSTSYLQHTNEDIRIGAKKSELMFERISKNDAPKTLVCHDMKGGYLDDCHLDGTGNCEAYSYTQWYATDIFVYFSHHFITIPPPSWVHAGHIHGVTVLGTIITEWSDGAKLCSEIFATKSSVNRFVESLVRLTNYHNFDGWLVNIENEMAAELIENVVYFLKRLKNELVASGNPGQVIWYDSILKNGQLKWQNELNDYNKLFFDASDAIFLNYNWSSETLAKSIESAIDRKHDIFVGVDVFGRGCYGGGGFNTCKALSVIRSYGLSCALFAPGWVYECHQPAEFVTLNAQFWKLLLPYLFVHGPKSLPIRTSFCPGFGKLTCSLGKVVEEKPWHNMSKQQLQPLLGSLNGLFKIETEDAFKELKNGLVAYPFGCQEMSDDAFEGGQSLRLFSYDKAVFPLFVCRISSPKTLKIVFILRSDKLESLNFSILCTSNSTAYQIIFPVIFNKTIEDSCSTVANLEDQLELSELLGDRIAHQSEWTTRGVRVLLKTTDTFVEGLSFYSDEAVDCKVGYFCCF